MIVLVHLLMTIVHIGPVTLTGLPLPLGHPIDLTGVTHIDMIIMMTEIPTAGLGVMIDTTKVDMTALDTIIGMAGQTAILHRVMADATTTIITILHLIDNGKVKDYIRVKTRVIIIPVVMVGILSIKKVTEARKEAIILVYLELN